MLAAFTIMRDRHDPSPRVWPERVDHYDVWLVMHTDLSRSARVRAAADAIIASFPNTPPGAAGANMPT